MKNSWLVIIAVAVIAYLMGARYPSTGESLLAKVGV